MLQVSRLFRRLSQFIISKQNKKTTIIQLYCILFLLFLHFCYIFIYNDSTSSNSNNKNLVLKVKTTTKILPNDNTTITSHSFDNIDFYEFLFDHLLHSDLKIYKNRPINSKLTKTDKCNDNNKKELTFDSTKKLDFVSYTTLKNCYSIPNDDFKIIKNAQSSFIDNCINPLTAKKHLFINQLFPNDKGIVTVGGGKYTILSYTLIKLLREKGTTLPIEVYIPPPDENLYDESWFCDTILPTLNAKCIYLPDRIPVKFVRKMNLKTYQHKSFAIWASTFKKVLFLDADNLPVKNLNSVFETSSFQENGLIFWPDIWRRQMPPDFYDLFDKNYDLNNRIRNVADDITPPAMYDLLVDDPNDYKDKIPFADLYGTIADPSSETGQILIDKDIHFETLLLSLFFNYYGNELYYYMFSLGGSGQGDKETFISAAHILDMPYYQVKKTPEFDGFWHPDRGFLGLALLQHDFEQDYNQYESAKIEMKKRSISYENFEIDYSLVGYFEKKILDSEYIDVMFVHYGLAKLEPFKLFNDNLYIDENGEQIKGLRKENKYFGFKLEKFIFETVTNLLCPVNDDDGNNNNNDDSFVMSRTDPEKQLGYYMDKVVTRDWDWMCVFLQNRVKWLKDYKLEKKT